MRLRQRLLLPTSVALLACAAACDRAPPPSPPAPAPTATPTSSAAPTPASPTSASPEASVVYAGFGGVGPHAPPGVPNPVFTAAIVEVSSPGADLAGVHVVAMTLIDDTGRLVASAKGTIDVRIAAPGREPYDFAPEGTTPFTGRVGRGASVRLLLNATLDTSAEVLRKAPAAKRARIELAADGGGRVVIEGPVRQWPTG